MDLKIIQLDRLLPDGVVVTVHWTASLTDGDLTASTYGACGLDEKNPTDQDFILFDDLTEQIVIDWVKNKLGEEIEANLNGQIEALKTPTITSGIPWNIS